MLPLDDCLYALQATIPHLTRSTLHRCLQRYGISRLPKVEGDKPVRKNFKTYPIGYFHIDIAEVQTAEGKLYLYVAIDRTSKFAFVQVTHKTGRTSASAFLEALIAAVPYKIHTVLTDNGIQFTFPPRYANGPTARYMTHMFDMRCRENGIEHRLTKVKHPWTNGQVERMNRTIMAALMGTLVIAAPAARAQTAPSVGTPPAPPAVELYSAADAQAVLNARILALKTVINMTPEQEKLWPPVEAAIRAVAKQSAERRAERAKAPQPADFVDILDRIADAEALRARDLKMVTVALKPLVGSLTAEQQRRIPAFLGLREGAGLPQPTAEIWLFEEEN